jgi:hypothetical protein
MDVVSRAYSRRNTSTGLTPIAPARRQHAGERYDCEKQHTNAAQHKRIDRLDLEQQVPY